MKFMGGRLAPLARLPVKFLRVRTSVERSHVQQNLRVSYSGYIIPESKVRQLHGTGIGGERALPVLSHIEAIK